MAVSIKLGGIQIIGIRDEQQDAIVFTDENDNEFIEHGGLLVVVADGIGGHAHGGEASRQAVKAFLQDYKAKPRATSIQDALYHALIQANCAVLEFAESQGEVENCGTTLVAAVLHPGSCTLHWISIGDSRMYLLRDRQLVQFTSDANYGNHLIKKVVRGIMTRDTLCSEEAPHRLTGFLGLKKLIKIDRSIRPFPLREGDQVLLCTDGIYQALCQEELVAECLLHEPQEACNRLVRVILKKNLDHQDNATVAILAYGSTESKGIAPSNTAAFSREDESEAIWEPANAHSMGKMSRWLPLAVMAVGLLVLLVVAWIGKKDGKPAYAKKVIEMGTPALKQQAGPQKLSPKR